MNKVEAMSGEYDRRVTVWRNDPDRVANDDGQRPDSPEQYCERWASIRPARPTERLVSAQLKADVTHEIRMRRDTLTVGITAAYWITLADGTRFDIRGVFDVDYRKMELKLECNQRA